MRVHPEFDPKTQTWFITEPIRGDFHCLADLFAELSQRFPKVQFGMDGYIPAGSPSYRHDWGPVVTDTRDAADRRALELARDAERARVPIPRKTFASEPIPGMGTGRKRKTDVERVLNHYAAGLRGVDIAAREGVTPTTISLILKEAREVGDRRAFRNEVVKKPPPSERETEGAPASCYRDPESCRKRREAILNLWDKGESQSRIATCLKLSQTTVQNTIRAARDAGDPRAHMRRFMGHETGLSPPPSPDRSNLVPPPGVPHPILEETKP